MFNYVVILVGETPLLPPSTDAVVSGKHIKGESKAVTSKILIYLGTYMYLFSG